MIAGSEIETMIAAEAERFAKSKPVSADRAKRAAAHWHRGVPFHWMLDWGTPFPLFVKEAKGAH